MKFLFKTLVLSVFLAFVTVPNTVLLNGANAYQAGREALMIIRYNQKQISYQTQLYSAVAEAVKAKPTVIFDVIGYAPQTNSIKKNKRYYENAQYYGQKVRDDMARIGVNPQQITFTTQVNPNLKNEEVRIFVR